MRKFLNIAIPTYNRASRLAKTLEETILEIKASGVETKVGIFVVDNASSDETPAVLEKYYHHAKSKGIDLVHCRQTTNVGAGLNFIDCALLSNSLYIAYLSDDDNLFKGAISILLKKLERYGPNVAILNFDQQPWGVENPLYKQDLFFESKGEVSPLQPQAKFYKLSGIVLKIQPKDEIRILRKLERINGFGHILLSIILGKSRGKILLSEAFFAYPDEDYLNHINFAPYVSEIMLYELNLLVKSGLITYEDALVLGIKIPRQSVLARSIHRLYEYYTGKFFLTLSMKRQLWANVKDALFYRRNTSSQGLSLFVSPKDYLRLFRLFMVILKFGVLKALLKSYGNIKAEGF